MLCMAEDTPPELVHSGIDVDPPPAACYAPDESEATGIDAMFGGCCASEEPERVGMYMLSCASPIDEPESTDSKTRCGKCSEDMRDKDPITLHCLHTFCLSCIKGIREEAVQSGQSDRDILYCPQCADPTTLTDGSVENIRPFFVANQVKDLHALSQMTHEKDHRSAIIFDIIDPQEVTDPATQRVDSIDSTSYTIEGPGPEEILELDNEVADIMQRSSTEIESDFTEDTMIETQGEATFTEEPILKTQGKAEFADETKLDKQNEPDAHLCICCQGKLDAVMYCFSCGKAMCLFCLEDHNKTGSTQDHFTVDVSKETIIHFICSIHDQFFRNFCLDCGSAACSSCHGTLHEGHKLEDFCAITNSEAHTTLSTKKSSNLKVMEKVEEMNSKLGTYAESMTARMEQFETDAGYLRRQTSAVKRYAVQVQENMEYMLKQMIVEVQKNNHKLSDYEDELLSHQPLDGVPCVAVSSFSLKFVEGISDENVSITTEEEELNDLQKWCNEETDTHNIFEKCMTPEYKQCKTIEWEDKVQTCRAPQYADEMSIAPQYELQRCRAPQNDTAMCMASVNDEIYEVRNEVSPLQIIDEEVAFDVTTVDKCMTPIDNQLELVEGYQLEKPPELVTHVESPIVITRATHERYWSVRQKTRSVGALPDGTVIAVGRDELHMYSVDGNKLSLPFPESELQEPWKLAVHQATSRVAVVDPSINGFTIFTPDPLLVHASIPMNMCTWTCATHLVEGANVPMSVTFSDDGNIFLGTGSAKTLLKYTCDGELLWEKPLQHECYYLASDLDNRIITSGGGSVHIHDANGEELHAFPQVKEQLEDPWGVCTDSQNNIYICELNRPTVVVFTSSGRYIREFELDSWPRNIAIFHDKLVIGSLHSIEVHQLRDKTV